jgi:hypothetical protein
VKISILLVSHQSVHLCNEPPNLLCLHSEPLLQQLLALLDVPQAECGIGLRDLNDVSCLHLLQPQCFIGTGAVHQDFRTLPDGEIKVQDLELKFGNFSLCQLNSLGEINKALCDHALSPDKFRELKSD